MVFGYTKWREVKDTIKFCSELKKYEYATGTNPFKELCDIVFYVLLPYSNAEVERVFSIINRLKLKLRNKIRFTRWSYRYGKNDINLQSAFDLYCYHGDYKTWWKWGWLGNLSMSNISFIWRILLREKYNDIFMFPYFWRALYITDGKHKKIILNIFY